MNQTLLAIFALILATLIAFNATRDGTQRELREVQAEVEVLATAAGLDILAQIGAKPFDAATAAGPVTDRNALTPLPFPTGRTFQSIADVDDANEMLPMEYESETGGLSVFVGAEVRYVSETDLSTTSTTPTFAKAVTVQISHTLLSDTIELTQVFTYP